MTACRLVTPTSPFFSTRTRLREVLGNSRHVPSRCHGPGASQPEESGSILADGAETPVRRERVLYTAHGVEIVALEGERGITFQKRVPLGEHVVAITAESDDPGVAEAWVRHLERLAAVARGAERGEP